MWRKLLLAGLVLPALLCAGANAAEPLTLTQASPPTVYHPAGRAIDVIGIAPGMSPNQVEAILQKGYGGVQVLKDDLGLEDHGVAVETQSYITRMTAAKDGDEISVWFGTPTTGNAVVEVTRQLSWPLTTNAPELARAKAELIGKYGPPGFDGPAVGTGEVLLLAWSYKGDKPSPCKASSCRADLSDGVDVVNLASYQRAVHSGHDLTIVATLLTGIPDATRAASVVVTLSDAATKMRTLEAAISQMKAAINGHHAPEKKPVSAKD